MLTVSPSQVVTFRQCPRAWYLKYHDRDYQEARKDPVGIEAFAGQAVHAALEYVYKILAQARDVPVRHALLFLREWWKVNYSEEHVYSVRNNPPSYYIEQAEQNVQNWYAMCPPKWPNDCVATEQYIEHALAPDVTLCGTIDRVDRAGDVLTIHDYKTGRQIMPASTLLKNLPLRVYAALARQHYEGIRVVIAEWHYLVHKVTLSVTVPPSDAGRVLLEVRGEAIKMMALTEDCEARLSQLCPWCGTREQCEAMEAGNG